MATGRKNLYYCNPIVPDKYLTDEHLSDFLTETSYIASEQWQSEFVILCSDVDTVGTTQERKEEKMEHERKIELFKTP